jgi:hypothetical protein
MRRLLRRHVLGYALGLLTALAGFGVGAAWAGHKAGNNTVHACASHGNGALYLQTADGTCKPNDATVEWSITGPQGPQGQKGDKGDKGDAGAQGAPGTINRAVSPNGVFTLTLGDAGILLKGPRGSVTVDFQGVRMSTIGGSG